MSGTGNSRLMSLSLHMQELTLSSLVEEMVDQKLKKLWIAIIVLSLACIGLSVAVIILFTQGDAQSEVVITTTTAKPIASTTAPATTTVPTTTTAPTTPVPPGGITDDDLRSFSEELLKADKNNRAEHVTVNLDPDEGEMLLQVDDEAFKCPTVQALIKLLDNFKAPVDVDDDLGEEHNAEKEEFLDLLLNTEIMKITEEWMTGKGIIPIPGTDLATLHDVVDHIWFMPYAGSHSPSGVNDSTGFEHTFVGQKYNGNVKGLHNWIRFTTLEQAGNITYLDYANQTVFDADGEDKGSVLKFSYDWDEDSYKDNGTMFIGTSPELEIALYTACYFARPNTHCPVKLNGKEFSINTMDHNGLRVVAVANPDI